MSIESLKQQARRHEQNEEWDKALEQYTKAIEELSQDEQTDIGLVNRVCDLFVRVGKVDKAVEYFEQAVDLYREAFLPNNAIAVCKKIIRSAPNRPQVYLKIGQIRAEQGFLPDARANFLTYAERMQKSGNLDESFRALVEFCDLAPDDVQVRITVADQMASNKRTGEAVQQLLVAYRHLSQSGEVDLAKGIEKKILALDPNADLGSALAAGAGSSVSADGEIEASFGEIELGGAAEARAKAEASDFSMAKPEDLQLSVPAGGGIQEEEEEGGFDLPTMSIEEPAGAEEEAQEEEGGGFDLPMMSFYEADAKQEEAPIELPMMGFDEPAPAEEEPVTELPMMSFDESEAPAVEAGLTDFGSGPSQAMQEAMEEARPEPVPSPARPAAAPPPPAAPKP
ncbi:MAG: hypothetical protein FJ207_14910, partial [Gemmatimonadetes bacterium]|nr:hypothetical protein [Gemmatimonadota bacterium]